MTDITGTINFGPEIKEAFWDLREKQRQEIKQRYDHFAARLDYAISLLEKQIAFLEKNEEAMEAICKSCKSTEK